MGKIVKKKAGKTFSQQFGFPMPLKTVVHYKRIKGKRKVVSYEFK